MASASLSTPGVLESMRVGFAMHLLQQKIEFLAYFAGAVEAGSQIARVAAQASRVLR